MHKYFCSICSKDFLPGEDILKLCALRMDPRGQKHYGVHEWLFYCKEHAEQGLKQIMNAFPKSD